MAKVRSFPILIAMATLIVLQTCAPDGNGGTTEVPYKYELVQTGYHYIKADSSIGSVPFYSTICTIDDTDYIAISNLNHNHIELHPIPSGQLKIIPVDEVAFGTLKSFYIQNWDSIFIYVRGPRKIHPARDKELYIIDSKGELVALLPYASQLVLHDRTREKQDEFAESVLNNQWDPVSFVGPRLIFGLIPYNRKSGLGKKYFSAELDIRSGKVKYHPIYLDAYSANSLNVYQNPIKHVDRNARRILFGLRGTPTLQIYNLEDGPDAKVELQTIPSDFLGLQHAPSQEEIAQSPARKSMLQVLNNWGEYGKILQSPDDFYVRFVYHAKQDSIFRTIYGNEKTPGVYNRLCSVILFDKNFQKIGESGTFEGLVDRNAGFSKDGTLYILDYPGRDSREKRIRYAKFKIQEIKLKEDET